ncbi:MAG: DsrE family protein [Desulfomonilaceae bacterium]
MVRLYKAVFHLDSDKEQTLILALGNINNLFKEIPAQQCDINIVANGTAVKLFKKDTVPNHAKAIEELHKLGVHFKMCNNALTYNKISKYDLIDFCEIVPAGIVEIIDLQRMGFAYIKP